jgi:tRNA U34 5-methylaminomethyl-2-thiouridine-forming methyltransferase MnmC
LSHTLIETADGSHSLFVKELNEHYHSTHGAIQESLHVFINAGLHHVLAPKEALYSSLKNELKILEVGFGTGLNALLTCIEAEKRNAAVFYTSIEAFPLGNDIIPRLNYASRLNAQAYQEIFDKLHACEWSTKVAVSDFFAICKIHNTLQATPLTDNYNLIYFDAFGPPVQPEMWTEEVFTKLYNVLEPNGYLVTYCAKGEVKRTLKRVGFTIESIPGPPGKREMIRAKKIK